MYIKVDATNNIIKYPYFLTDLKADNPKISFPRTALEDNITRQQFNILEVESTSNPAADTQTAVEIINPAGIGKPNFPISARFAPFPPK